MTTLSAPPTDEAEASSPAPVSPQGSLARRGRFWVAVGVLLLIVVAGSLVVAGLSAANGQPLGPTSAQAAGAQALVTVLRENGVKVVTTTTLDETKRAASADPGATVLVFDGDARLTSAKWKTAAGLGRHTVAVEPDAEALTGLAPSVRLAESGLDGTLRPECSLPALSASARVTGTGSGYRTSDPEATLCLPESSKVAGYGLVELASGAHTITIVGTPAALSNGTISDHDNAAFALRLLGESQTLVWYLPGIDDLGAGSGTLASLTPGWVTPSIALLAAAVVAGAVWRGRRLGPLVVENLPVVVRSTETMEGRARLYERGQARTHALDQLRIGSIGRLAERLGLGRGATVDDVVDRVAELLPADRVQLRLLLVEAEPADDQHLLRLSDGLRDLEADVARAARTR